MAVYSNSKQFTNTSYGNYTHYVSMTYTQNVIDNYTNVSNLVAKLQNRTPNLSFPYGTLTGTITIYKWQDNNWVLQFSDGINSSVNLNTSNIVTLKNSYPNANIYHNDDGSCRIKIVYTTAMSGVVAGPDGTSTFEFDLPKIPRNSSLNSVTDLISNSASSFDVENNNFKLNITKNVATYYDKLVVSVKKSDDSLVDLVEVNDVINENEISLNDYKSVIYENSIDTALPIIRFSIYTYTDETMETQIGSVSYKELTGIINSVPIINGFSYEDSNNTTLSKTGNNQTFIKYYSTLTLSDFDFEAQNSATITNINVNGNVFAYTDNMVVNISNYDLDYVSVYAIDSRGLTSAEYKIALNVKNYFNMIKNESSYTRTGYTDECIFKFRGQFFNDTFGAKNNSLVINYRYKNVLANEDEWQTGTSTIKPTLNGNEFMFDGALKGDNDTGFGVTNSFDVEIVVSDAFSSVSYKYQVISGIPAIDVYKSKLGLCKNYDETSTHDIEGTDANFESLFVDGKEVALKEDSSIIYQTKITEQVFQVDINDLDITDDGAEYELSIVGSFNVSADIYIRINGIDSGYYQGGVYWTGSGTESNTTLTANSGYRPNMSAFYYAIGGRKVWSKISFRFNMFGDKFLAKWNCVSMANNDNNGGQVVTMAGGYRGGISTVKKISLSPGNSSGRFNVGTIITLRKIK